MNKLNVRKGDKVRIISGKDSGKEGKILTAMPEKSASSWKTVTWSPAM